jgi:hypothetical protein
MLIPPYQMFIPQCHRSFLYLFRNSKMVVSSFGDRLRAWCPIILLCTNMALIEVGLHISFRRKPLLGHICISFVKVSLHGLSVNRLKPVRMNNIKYVGVQT